MVSAYADFICNELKQTGRLSFLFFGPKQSQVPHGNITSNLKNEIPQTKRNQHSSNKFRKSKIHSPLIKTVYRLLYKT
jgi:hypothetical protein